MQKTLDATSVAEHLIHRYFEEVWNQGHLDVLDEIMAPDYQNHSSSIPDPVPGPAGLRPIVAAMRQAFPDLHYEIQDLVVTGTKVAVRVHMTGTHLGDFFGIAPTGQQVRVQQFQIEWIREGQIVAHWRQTDDLTLMRQLGVIQ
ncbi:ester cyclase [Deinococcus cellulosilyticus]|uniref:Ester cyclase n=1 Tax=Deinococcus cellulosilyticus (strain DSM 18568 / NBRC 106333 / KACC 11606 / 5516J-15) TaxID=1223518 RepID=A0A511MVK2_DEIC1|nr:ester cyclase [Deinococcus cellulosilyticus]GEM44613.1 hypothetical protein DC3_02480 [Deinococcus cellulosilyticus NBRC 106333 = KACC 11606]